jgi:glycosyltransferase involved in cell wall biosynthesis
VGNKKRIALITTWFPPQQSVATNRMLAFVEYLSTDYELEVFCLDTKKYKVRWSKNVTIHYESASSILEKLKDLQSDGRILHKAKVGTRIILSKFIKNPLMKWQKASTLNLVDCHKENPFDLIISSFSPQEAHMVAVNFCKQFATIPWIADMRDEMSANPYIDQNTKNNLKKVEKDVNAYATAILSVSKPIVDDFKALCPDIQYFEEIRNGFNHSFKRDLTNTSKNAIFTFGYFGTFYGSRKPAILFEALKQLNNEIEDFNFNVAIIGAHQNYSVPSEISENVQLFQSVSYLEAINKMAEMDINVQLHPRSEQKGIFTGKLFDYISVQKPVLALVDTEDVAAQLINEFQCGYVAEFSDLEATKQMIKEAYEDWKAGRIRFATNKQVESLHRKKQIERLKVLIETLLVSNH